MLLALAVSSAPADDAQARGGGGDPDGIVLPEPPQRSEPSEPPELSELEFPEPELSGPADDEPLVLVEVDEDGAPLSVEVMGGDQGVLPDEIEFELPASATGAPGASRLAAPTVGEVELTGQRWRGLQRDAPLEPDPLVVRREVQLRRVEGGVLVRSRHVIEEGRDRLFGARVAGPTAELRRLAWNGREVTRWATPQGPLVVERMRGPAVLEVETFVAGDPSDGLSMVLLAAPRGPVTLEGFEPDIVLVGDERPVVERGGVWWSGAEVLRLAPRQAPPRDRGPLAVARVGLGVTVGDAEVRGHARLRWEIRQGTRREVAFTVAGVGDDLSVEGPLVGRWERSGDRVLVELSGPAQGRVDLDLRWSIASPRGAEARVPMPSVVPEDVFRSVVAVQVARDGEVDVRPELDRPWRPIAQAQLPDYAEGLVEGTPTAAFVRPRAEAGDDDLQLLRLEPVPGPPMVIDVADLHLAVTDEGRTLMRMRYEVRNERASHLSLTPPPGMRLVGVEVAGRPVTPAHDGDAVRIPLKRSIETIRGLLTVPVTVALLGEGDDWDRRVDRDVLLPAVDAPVNVARVTVVLPPRYRSRLSDGEHGVVEAFTEGNGVGYGLADDAQVGRADRIFARAVAAWNDNDFAGTRDQLDALARLGAWGTNPEGLQANVALVMPRAPRHDAAEPAMNQQRDDDVYDFDDDDLDGELLTPQAAPMPSMSSEASGAVARRIRARLRARSGKKKVEFDRRKSKAKSLKDAGRYEEAAAEYRQAIEDSRDLGRLEDEESVEYDYEADALADELKAVEQASDVSSFADEGADLDLVGGMFVVLRASSMTDDDDLGLGTSDETIEEGPLDTAPLPSVPRVGEGIRYQQLLLDAGEQRSVRVEARRISRWRAQLERRR